MLVTRYRLLIPLTVLCAWTVPTGAQQDKTWIYDIFVQKCRESGGTPGSTREQYMRGERFVCQQSGTGASTAAPNDECRGEAKANVDWVFTDGGARARYSQQRGAGGSPFDAVMGAQAHNPRVQALLRRCKSWVESYLQTRGPLLDADKPQLSKHKLGPADCRCMSVLPTGTTNFEGRPGYRVSNSCEALRVSIRFVGDILSLSPNYALSSAGDVGLVAPGRDQVVYAPDWKLVSIKALTLTNASSSHTCSF